MENHNEGCPYGIHEFQVYHQQQHHGTTTTTNTSLAGGGEEGSERISGEACASVVPWSLPPVHSISPVQFHTSNSVGNQDCFLPSFPSLSPAPQPSPPPYYGELFARRASTALQFGYDGSGVGLPSDPLGLSGFCTGPQTLAREGAVSSSSSYPIGGLQAPFTKMTTQEIMDAKALAASKSHSEAERRRRERINGHLAKLRSLLPSSTKTDKASLLAEVIQHVKELRQQTSEIAEESPLPTETDELTVDTASDDEGRFVVRASLCCEDRSDLLPDLIKALKALKLRALKAEITTLGGRVKNVLVITGEDDSDRHQQQQSISIVQDALKAVMEQAPADETSSGVKRQRTNSLANVLEHRSI